MAVKGPSLLQRKLAEAMEKRTSFYRLCANQRAKIRISSRPDAMAMGRFVRYLAEQPQPLDPSDFGYTAHLIFRGLTRTREPVAELLAEQCIEPLEEICERTLEFLGPEPTELSESFLYALCCLAVEASPRSVELTVRAARKPVAPMSESWYHLLGDFFCDPENARKLYTILSNPFPPENISKYLLVMVNERGERLELPKHLFDCPEGHELLEQWVLEYRKAAREGKLWDGDLLELPPQAVAYHVLEAAREMPESLRRHLFNLAGVDEDEFFDDEDFDDEDEEAEEERWLRSLLLPLNRALGGLLDFVLRPIDEPEETEEDYERRVRELRRRISGFATLDPPFRDAVIHLYTETEWGKDLAIRDAEIVDTREMEWPPVFRSRPLCVLHFPRPLLRYVPEGESFVVAGSDFPEHLDVPRGFVTPDDAYAYQFYLDMVSHGRLVEFSPDEDSESEYLARLQEEWPRPKVQRPVLRSVVQLSSGAHKREWLVFDATVRGHRGVLVIDGPNSAWYDPDFTIRDYVTPFIGKIHIGRELLGLGLRPDAYQPRARAAAARGKQ